MSRSNRLLAVYAHPDVIKALVDHADKLRLFPVPRASCTMWHERRAVEVWEGSVKKTVHRWVLVEDGVQTELPPLLHCPPEEHDARVAEIVAIVLKRAG